MGLSQKFGSNVFFSSSKMSFSLDGMSKIPPKLEEALLEIFYFIFVRLDYHCKSNPFPKLKVGL